MDRSLTAHAQARLQQRGIPPAMIDYLFDFGAAVHDHHGAELLYFDRAARRRLERACGREIVRRLDRFLNSYVVVAGNGDVATVGRRYRRIRR